MPSINTISIDKLVRLIGTPKCPALVDVHTEEDFAAPSPPEEGILQKPQQRQ